MDSSLHLLIARNPDPDSTLEYLIMVPIEGGIVLKSSDTWPRTKALYCHQVPIAAWPECPDIVEDLNVVSCVRRGASIDIVVNRHRENRSQIVFTVARGRNVIFWQSPRTLRQARPKGVLPRAKASGLDNLAITIDTREHYPYGFKSRPVVTTKRALPCGDYGLYVDEKLFASVERKTLDDLIASLTSGKLRYALGQLASLPRAAVVVEARYSAILQTTYVRPAVVLDGIADCYLRWPEVPIVFCENRKLAEEWTYRYLAGAYQLVRSVGDLATNNNTEGEVDAGSIRRWAKEQGLEVSDKGPLSKAIQKRYLLAHGKSIAE